MCLLVQIKRKRLEMFDSSNMDLIMVCLGSLWGSFTKTEPTVSVRN